MQISIRRLNSAARQLSRIGAGAVVPAVAAASAAAR
jgi:hypothetical protein